MDKLREKAEKAFQSQRSFKASDKEPFIKGYLAAIKDVQESEKVEYRVKSGTYSKGVRKKYSRLIMATSYYLGDNKWEPREYYIAEYPDGGYEYWRRVVVEL